MSKRANLVVRLMDDLRRLSLPEDQMPKDLPIPNGGVDEHRPPKRPWEDTVDENVSPNGGDRGEVRLLTCYILRVHYELTPYTIQYSDDKMQSTAEQDMEIIRSKRATSAGGNAPGQPKSKYRKRSVCLFPYSHVIGVIVNPCDVHLAGHSARKVSFLQHPRNAGMETRS